MPINFGRKKNRKRNQKQIEGIFVENTKRKVIQFADIVMPFLSNGKAMNRVMNVKKIFQTPSALKLNVKNKL